MCVWYLIVINIISHLYHFIECMYFLTLSIMSVFTLNWRLLLSRLFDDRSQFYCIWLFVWFSLSNIDIIWNTRNVLSGPSFYCVRMYAWCLYTTEDFCFCVIICIVWKCVLKIYSRLRTWDRKRFDLGVEILYGEHEMCVKVPFYCMWVCVWCILLKGVMREQ